MPTSSTDPRAPAPARRPHVLGGTLGDEDGTTAAEYVGVLVVVGAVVAALAISPLGAALTTALEVAVCTVLDQPRCGDDGTQLAGDGSEDQAPPVCTLTTSEYSNELTTDFIFDRSVSGDRFVIEEHADGTLVIIDTEFEGDGTSLSAGAEVPIGKAKVGVSASTSDVQITETGRTYVLDTPEKRQQFNDVMGALARDAYMHGGGLGELNDLLSGETTPQDHVDREMFIEAVLDSMAEKSYHSVSDASELEIGGSIKFVSAGLSFDASEGAIIEEDLTTGAFTVHTQVTEGSSGSLGVALLGNVHGGDDASYTLSVSFDAEGTPTEVAVSESYTIAQGAQLAFDPSTLADLPAAIQTAVGISSGESDVDHLDLRASVALDDASEQAVLDGYLADPETGGDALYELLDRRGELLVQRYDGAETSEGASIGVGLLANLAAESGQSARELTLTDAWSWDPANGGLHRSDCLD